MFFEFDTDFVMSGNCPATLLILLTAFTACHKTLLTRSSCRCCSSNPNLEGPSTQSDFQPPNISQQSSVVGFFLRTQRPFSFSSMVCPNVLGHAPWQNQKHQRLPPDPLRPVGESGAHCPGRMDARPFLENCDGKSVGREAQFVF